MLRLNKKKQTIFSTFGLQENLQTKELVPLSIYTDMEMFALFCHKHSNTKYITQNYV